MRKKYLFILPVLLLSSQLFSQGKALEKRKPTLELGYVGIFSGGSQSSFVFYGFHLPVNYQF